MSFQFQRTDRSFRNDFPDLLVPIFESKFKAVVDDIKERHAKGQPILVGTVAVETSELISGMLRQENIPHQVLNAKNHFREAEIIIGRVNPEALLSPPIWPVVVPTSSWAKASRN